jgi:ATP-dependent DNA ligase
MLLDDWQNFDEQTAREIEADQHEWIVQPKLDGVRALLHVGEDSVRITGRCFSDVTYRLSEHQDVNGRLKTGHEWALQNRTVVL